MDYGVKLVQLDSKDYQEDQEQQVEQALLVSLEPQDQEDFLVHRELQGVVDSLVILVYLEHQV